MSATFSNSPELRLRIAESRYPRLFLLVLVCLHLANLCLLGRSGASGWALAALCLTSLACYCVAALQYRRRRRQRRVLGWRQGQWWLAGESGPRPIEPLRWHCLPWCTYLAWREADGRRGDLWLFADSAPRDEQRRLRVRLTLQRAV